MTLFTPTSKWQLEEHQLFSESVKKFYSDEVKPNLEQWGEQQRVDRKLWNKAGDAGQELIDAGEKLDEEQK